MLPESIFTKDHFSTSRPTFQAINSNLIQEVGVALLQFEATTNITEMQQLGGFEVNSKNFKVTSTTGTYLLKKQSDAVEELTQRLSLCNWLFKEGCQVPRHLTTLKGGSFYKDQQDKSWSLWDFVKGNYFTGHPDELSPTSQAIQRFNLSLDVIPLELYPKPDPIDYSIKRFAEIIAQTDRARDKWTTYFGPVLDQCLTANWPSVLASLDQLQEASDHLATLDVKPSHMDLHPHNMLLEGSKFSVFLDLDSIKMVPREIACGFAVYKLMRQHIAAYPDVLNDDSLLKNRLTAFCDTIYDCLKIKNRRDSYFIYSKVEIFRRLVLILDLNFNNNNRDWNHVMDIQIRALREIDRLYCRN